MTEQLLTLSPEPKQNVPEKFWDKEKKEVRVEELLKSYRELEKKLSKMISLPEDGAGEEEMKNFHRMLGVPENPQDYDVKINNSMFEVDPDVNAKLCKAGFTPAQVQMVYDLAEEKIIPVIADMACEYEASRQLEKLVGHFGGQEKWLEISRQINNWGSKNLPKEAMEALGTTYEGVMAIYRMMTGDEPALNKGANMMDPRSTEADLKQLMADPKYWRDKDPEFINKVTNGFSRLYPSGK